MMLAGGERIPLEGVHEVPVIQALVEQRRRFVKPLRDDAPSAAVFPTALQVDAGSAPAALRLVSTSMSPGERAATRAIARAVSLRATVPAFDAVALRPDRANVSRRPAALRLRELLDGLSPVAEVRLAVDPCV